MNDREVLAKTLHTETQDVVTECYEWQISSLKFKSCVRETETEV